MSQGNTIKILVIVNAIFGYDGISSVATNYYRYQDKNRVKMDILTINDIPQTFKQEIVKDGNHHFIVSCRNSNPIKYVLVIKKIIRQNKYDIVYVHGNSATMAVDLLGALLGGCRVRIAHSHNTQCNHQTINKLLMPVFSKLYTGCCACSTEAGQFLFGNRECYVVNNGLYLPKYEFNEKIRSDIREKYGLTNKVVIGHVGRFTYQKNQEFLVELLSQMICDGKEVSLLLVGGGETLDNIKKLATQKDVMKNIVFYGTTDFVNEVVQAMDCFVFPSRFEGLGIAALEAQASGINCIASEQVPRKMKVNKGTMFLSLASDKNKWIDAIYRSLVTVDERKKNVKREKEQFLNAGYDIEQNCKEILKFYERVLLKGKR